MNCPRVSIGLAVYNGERYLKEALDSILIQTFSDFELIISDNASIDRTAEICRDYAAKDDRIRYSRNKTNIGGANNENLTFKLSRGEYFRWAAHDDVCAPELLAKCVAVLDQNPSVVLCHSIVVQIDEHGQRLGSVDRNRGNSPKSYVRFRRLAGPSHLCYESYGLIRADILRKTPLQLNYSDSDRTLLSELALYGQFYQVPEPLFYKRLHEEMSTQVYYDSRDRMAWFNPELRDRIVFPNWIQFFDFFRVISRVPLTPYERLRCYLYILGPWLRTFHGKWMAQDLAVAASKLLHSFSRGRIRNRYTYFKEEKQDIMAHVHDK